MLIAKTALGAPPALLAATRRPAAQPAHDRPLAASDVLAGVAPLGLATGVDHKVLGPNPAFLGVPDEKRQPLPPGRPRVPWPTSAVPRNAGAVALAAAETGRAIAVRPTPRVLGLSDGPAAVAHGEVRGRPDLVPVLAPVLRAKKERLTGATPSVAGVRLAPRPPEVHQARA